MSSAILGSHLSHDKNFGVPSIYFGDTPVGKVNDVFLAQAHEDIVTSACYWSAKRTVYWLTPYPELPKDAPRWLARKILLTGQAELTISRAEYDSRNQFVKKL